MLPCSSTHVVRDCETECAATGPPLSWLAHASPLALFFDSGNWFISGGEGTVSAVEKELGGAKGMLCPNGRRSETIGIFSSLHGRFTRRKTASGGTLWLEQTPEHMTLCVSIAAAFASCSNHPP